MDDRPVRVLVVRLENFKASEVRIYPCAANLLRERDMDHVSDLHMLNVPVQIVPCRFLVGGPAQKAVRERTGSRGFVGRPLPPPLGRSIQPCFTSRMSDLVRLVEKHIPTRRSPDGLRLEHTLVRTRELGRAQQPAPATDARRDGILERAVDRQPLGKDVIVREAGVIQEAMAQPVADPTSLPPIRVAKEGGSCPFVPNGDDFSEETELRRGEGPTHKAKSVPSPRRSFRADAGARTTVVP